MNLATFAAEHLTVTFTEVPTRTDGSSHWMKGSKHFLVIMKTAEQNPAVCTINYSVGPGIVESFALTKLGGVVGPKDNPYRKGTVAYVEALQRASKGFEPDVVELLECLQGDFNVLNEECFEDWAENLGYDTDSRAAEKTYNACVKQARDFRSVVGREAFEVFLGIDPYEEDDDTTEVAS